MKRLKHFIIMPPLHTNRIYSILVFLGFFVLTIGCKKDNETNILTPLISSTQNHPKLVTSTDTLIILGTEIKELVITTSPNFEFDYFVLLPPWLSLSKYGTVSVKTTDTILVSIDSSMFDRFESLMLSGFLGINSNFGEKLIYVRAVIGYAIPDSLFFGPFEENKTIQVANAQNVPLDYSITVSNDFILPVVPAGTLQPKQTSDIAFTVNRASMLSGIYSSEVYIKIGGKIDTIHVKIENFVSQKLMLFTHVIDAEYSKSKDLMVFVTSSPARINVYNPQTNAISGISLSVLPTSVSLSPDGSKAVVGHNGSITYVDINTLSVIRTYRVPCNVLDIVLSGNNWAYILPLAPQWVRVHCVNLNLSQDNVSLHTGRTIYEGLSAKLHPSGQFIYTVNSLSSTMIEKFNIQNGVAEYLSSSNTGNLSTGSNLWISEDGLNIYTKGTGVYSSSSMTELDMRFKGRIVLDNNVGQVVSLDHSATTNNLFVISSRIEFWSNVNLPFLYVFDAVSLSRKKQIKLEKYLVGGFFYEAEPHFVFCHSNGKQVYVLTAMSEPGMNAAWAIQKIDVE